MLRYEDVADLLRVIDSSSCEELILDSAEFKIVVRRRGTEGAAPVRVRDEARRPAVASRPEALSPAPAAAPAPAKPAEAAPAAGVIEVRAPMVGTFYRSPAPGKPPFVEVGSVVSKGDQVCLIEVMKLFTSIFAQESGRIVQVCVPDAQLVEFGQLLFVLEPV